MSQAFANERLVQYHKRFASDFPFAARWTLKIRDKLGNIVPLILNDAQRYIHEQVEKQRMSTGKVRVLVLKGRQQGCSTYVSGRFYWKATHVAGRTVFILSMRHLLPINSFKLWTGITRMCQSRLKCRRMWLTNGAWCSPDCSQNILWELRETRMSAAAVLYNYLHASEAGFYPNASGFSTGLLQSVPDASDTEVFIESTANGMDGLFYPMCMNALQGKGDFLLIFVPWYWQVEYRRKLPPDFQITPEEEKLAQLYHLDPEQLCWRRMKIFELKDDTLFMREYPNSVEEAFTVSTDSLIPGILAAAARKFIITEPAGPLIVGTDPNEVSGSSASAIPSRPSAAASARIPASPNARAARPTTPSPSGCSNGLRRTRKWKCSRRAKSVAGGTNSRAGRQKSGRHRRRPRRSHRGQRPGRSRICRHGL